MVEAAIGLVEASLLPAIVAAIVLFAIRQLNGGRQAPGWSYSIAVAIAYCAGSAVALQFNAWPAIRSDWAALPARNWQWMFYLAPLAAIVGVTATAPRVPAPARWLLILVVSIAAAWLVTGIRTLFLPRPACVALLSAYFLLLAAFTEPLAVRIAPATLLALQGLAAAALAALVSYYASQTHGQIAATAAAALASGALYTWVTKQSTPPRGLSVAFAIIVGGWAAIEALSYNNLAAMLLLPAAPLALWACMTGPPAGFRGGTASAVQAAVVLTVISAAAVLLRIFVGQ